ncbi:MAG: RidA family protein, partial [Methylobacteriaceae bacterium]|nr:RidA family protein [Methylobacteriaceae bacterium]
MRHPVKTHLPSEEAPIEWAVTADGVLYTAQIPIREDGSIETGDMSLQADLTFANLKRTVEAAGGTLDDVTQVLVYLTRKEDFQAMNGVYRR